jgi:uncharacterized coiled-coil protein SlyX
MKVKCGAEEMKYKIMERKADIKRLEENITIQENRIKELEAKLTELEG